MRVAVLGCGSIGRRHIENLRSLGCTDLLLFDPILEAGVLSTLDEVWARKPDVAVIAAPSNLHTELALDAATRGCHLFIEKPLSHTIDRLDLLVHEAETKSVITMVACNMRFHPGPATIKRLIAAGAIGDVIAMRLQTGSYLPRWRPGQDYRESYSASPEWGGATLDCIHELDLAIWFGGPARVVGAASVPARAIGLQTEGLNDILLRHESGVVSNVHLNFVQRDYRRTCQIIGTEGTLAWDFNEHRVDRFGPDGERAETISEPDGWQLNQMYLDELEHFLESVRTGVPSMNPMRDAVNVLRVALTARAMGAAE
jgi:predicted dehydrogenase